MQALTLHTGQLSPEGAEYFHAAAELPEPVAL